MKMPRIGLIILVISIWSCHKSNVNRTLPNVVLINVDDMGWRDAGFMGSAYYETPHIDALSELGMVFTNGYAAASNCAPSRASLMTGQWTPRHGIYTVNSSERGKSEHRKIIPIKNTTTLSRDFQIIPAILGEYGYTTCHAGKWHLSEDPLEYGFDLNIGGGHNGHPRSYYPPYKNVDLKGEPDEYLTDLIMRKSLSFLDTVQSPFFLNYAPYAVHTPIQSVGVFLEKYEEKPVWNGQDNPAYATMVENLDRNIGLLVQKLKDQNLFEQTLIIFTSDNGGLYGITQQSPLRAGKGSYYEGGIREPFFVVYPPKVTSNQIDVPVSHLDILPTILHYVGIDSESLDLDGMNISEVIEGKAKAIDRPLFWHFPIYLGAFQVHDNENRDSLFRTRPGSVIRYGDWKLHYYFEDHEMELYDLAEDIGERNDLSDSKPEKREELLAILREWWTRTNAPIPEVQNPDYKGNK